jgi:hypothetical protein
MTTVALNTASALNTAWRPVPPAPGRPAIDFPETL